MLPINQGFSFRIFQKEYHSSLKHEKSPPALGDWSPSPIQQKANALIQCFFEESACKHDKVFKTSIFDQK